MLLAGMPDQVASKIIILHLRRQRGRSSLMRAPQAPSALSARTLEVFQKALKGQLGSGGQCQISTIGDLATPGLPR